MSFNPFEEKGIPLERQIRSWLELSVTPYDKRDIHPYSRCRAIVANGTEVEAIFFSHPMGRTTADSDIKKLNRLRTGGSGPDGRLAHDRGALRAFWRRGPPRPASPFSHQKKEGFGDIVPERVRAAARRWSPPI